MSTFRSPTPGSWPKPKTNANRKIYTAFLAVSFRGKRVLAPHPRASTWPAPYFLTGLLHLNNPIQGGNCDERNTAVQQRKDHARGTAPDSGARSDADAPAPGALPDR